MFLNRIFFVTLLYAYTCAAQSAIQIGSGDDIPYKIYRSAQSDSLDISARIEVFDPPITIDVRDVENLRLPENLDQPDLVLAKYLQTLTDGSGVESALGLYEQGDPSIAYWQSLSRKRPNYALGKLDIFSKMQWRDYYVYKLKRFQKGMSGGTEALVFVRCQNQRCYLSSPDYLWEEKDKEVFFSLIDWLSYPSQGLELGRASSKKAGLFYRFNLDGAAESDSELEFVVNFNWLKKPPILTLSKLERLDVKDMGFPVESLVNALTDIREFSAVTLDKSDTLYRNTMAAVFNGSLRPENVYLSRFQLSTERSISSGKSRTQCGYESSPDYIGTMLTWSEVIPVAYSRYVHPTRPDLLSRIGLFVKTKASTEGDYMLNVLYFSAVGSEPTLTNGAAGLLGRLSCLEATYPLFVRYLMESDS